MSIFQKATKQAAFLRLAISGPSGSGKTYTALTLATALHDRVALVDTEHGSASKYADLFDFDVVNLPAPYHPDRFGQMIDAAAEAGYGAIVIDSLTHAWNGPGGIMEIVDNEVARQKTANSYTAWAKATPIHQRLIDKIVSSPIHIIATMRSKTEYVLEEVRGKKVPRKVGMAPVQRDGMEYEFDLWMEMDADNNAIVQKSRCPALSNAVIEKPGADMAATLRAWLGDNPQVTAPAPAPAQASGDGAAGPPPQTWAQKIEAAVRYLGRFAESSESDWSGAVSATEKRIAKWPTPHRAEVDQYIAAVRKQRGEALEPAGPDVADGDTE